MVNQVTDGSIQTSDRRFICPLSSRDFVFQPEHLLLSDKSGSAKVKIVNLKFATRDGDSMCLNEQSRRPECENCLTEGSSSGLHLTPILIVAFGGKGTCLHGSIYDCDGHVTGGQS